ncbi:FtsX-like permease family protein [Streptomyces sp. NBC_00878]|uniref:FtsX-like permease family protein n=1 Tax=Streptomyces sp. NBC_00878 TaxID=2975854 RepID=UPI00225C1140|nr:FtsX-like permease family protein [Streptomyces sp. NBC_00878]MCX4911503.1 FtsX-like permease family protein [Streptomyces sp. NBC_00878]
MWALAFRTLKFRRTSFIATFLAMFLGAAIVIGCGGLMETGVRMVADPQRFDRTAVVVTGEQTYDSAALTERNRIDNGLVEKVASADGVRKAIGDVSFPAAVLKDGKPVTGESESYGHGWSGAELTPYTLAAGDSPAAGGEVVLDSRLAENLNARPGAGVELAVRGTTEKFRVSGIAAQRGGSNPDAAVFFTDAEARRLAGAGGRIDSIGVLADPGTDIASLTAAVKSQVGDRAEVLTGDRRGLAELPGTLSSQRTIVILAAIFGSSVVLIVMFGVASTLGLSLQQRSQEMALLRAVGATSDQLRRMILCETAVLSVLSVVLALAPGYAVGNLLYGVLTDSGVVSSAIAYRAGWVPMAVGAVTTVLAAALATRFAGRRAARTEPVAALAESVAGNRWFSVPRLLLALFFIANGVGLAVATATVMEDGPTLASTAGPASVLFCIGLALIAPGITKVMVALLRLPVRALSGLSGYLALRNATTSNVRMAGAIAPIVLLIGIATGTLYMQSTEDDVSARSYADNILADYVLDSTTGGFAPNVVDQVRTTSGVAAASELVTTRGFVDGPDGRVDMDLRGVSADGVRQTLALKTVTGDLAGLKGNSVALSAKKAEEFGVKVGDPLPMHLGDGSGTKPTVVALFEDNPKQQYMVLPSASLAPHTTDGLPHQILVRSDAGADGLQARLADLAAAVPGAELDDSSSLSGRNNQIQQILVSANYTIVAMIVGYAAITVVNTLVAVTRKRRAEFGLQRLTGATRAQVLGMLGVEGALIAVIATVLGTAASATTIVPYSLVKNDSILPAGSIGIYLGIVGGSLLLIFGATLYPSWRGMRQPAVDTVKAA